MLMHLSLTIIKYNIIIIIDANKLAHCKSVRQKTTVLGVRSSTRTEDLTIYFMLG